MPFADSWQVRLSAIYANGQRHQKSAAAVLICSQFHTVVAPPSGFTSSLVARAAALAWKEAELTLVP